jgi:hypothetical protein
LPSICMHTCRKNSPIDTLIKFTTQDIIAFYVINSSCASRGDGVMNIFILSYVARELIRVYLVLWNFFLKFKNPPLLIIFFVALY